MPPKQPDRFISNGLLQPGIFLIVGVMLFSMFAGFSER